MLASHLEIAEYVRVRRMPICVWSVGGYFRIVDAILHRISDVSRWVDLLNVALFVQCFAVILARQNGGDWRLFTRVYERCLHFMGVDLSVYALYSGSDKTSRSISN